MAYSSDRFNYTVPAKQVHMKPDGSTEHISLWLPAPQQPCMVPRELNIVGKHHSMALTAHALSYDACYKFRHFMAGRF